MPVQKRADALTRRGFLKTVGALPAAVSVAPLGRSAPTSPGQEQTLPQVPFGKYSMARLVCGANPFNGGSHLSGFVNRQMREYYTPDQIVKTLARCEQVGINFWQGSGDDYELYQRFVALGGKMHYIFSL